MTHTLPSEPQKITFKTGDDGRAELEMKAAAIRDEWERGLYEVKIEEHAKPVIEEMSDGNGLRIASIKPEKTAVRRLRPDSAERIMRRTVFEYLAFCNSGKMEVYMADLETSIALKFRDEVEMHGGEAATWRAAEMSAIANRVNRLKMERPSRNLLADYVRFHHPKADRYQILSAVWRVEKEMVSVYFSEYLPFCIETRYPALKKDDWLWQSALLKFIETGARNPVFEVIF